MGAGGGLLLGSRVLGAGPLAGLGIAAGLMLAAAAGWVATRHPRLAMSRSVHPGRLHVGSEGRVVLAGTAVTRTPLLTLIERIDDGRRAARFLVPPHPARSDVHAAYRFPTARRGRHVVGPLLATVSDPLGLVRRSFVVVAATDVVVCPRVHDVTPPLRGGGGEPAAHAEGARAPALEPLGEFLGLRPYEAGDDPRRVHWRATARTGELVVRQDEAASPGRVVLLLDTRPDAYDEASFETAVEVIASLAVRLRRDHAPAEVLTTSGDVLGRPGPGAVEILLERLAVVEPGGLDHVAAVVARLRDRLGIGSVVAATGALDLELAEALGLLRARKLVTVVTTRAPQGMQPRAAFPVIDVSSTGFPGGWNAVANHHSRRWNAATSLSPLRSAR